jgi:hypothetical protein
MSLGIIGPISREMAPIYGLIATFSRQGMLNKNACNCKVCGGGIEKAQGVGYTIDDVSGPNLSHYYLCAPCDAWMAGQVQQWFEYTKRVNAERADKGPVPHGGEADLQAGECFGRRKR